MGTRQCQGSARARAVRAHLDERVDVPLREAEHDDVGPGREARPLRLAGRRRGREAAVGGGGLALVGPRGPQDAVLGVQARRQRRPSGHGVCRTGKIAIRLQYVPERRRGWGRKEGEMNLPSLSTIVRMHEIAPRLMV